MLRPLTTLSLMLALAPMAVLAQNTAAPPIDGELKTALEAQPDVARGKSAYEVCEGCHRKDGSGRANGIYPRLAGQHARVMVKQLVDIRSGRRHNPDMAPLVAEPVLSLQAMADIAAYVQGLPVAANNGKGSGSELALGNQLYDRDCASVMARRARVMRRPSSRWSPRSTTAICCASWSTSATVRAGTRRPRW